MIRFSIITCTFNAEAVIERTLDSVLEQTHSHLEHLIIDGASKDRTVEMAQHYKTKSDEEDHCHDVIICSEPDGGLYDAMNKAIARQKVCHSRTPPSHHRPWTRLDYWYRLPRASMARQPY